MTEDNGKSFLSSAMIYGLGSILLQAASIVLLPLYLNYLPPEDYGVLEILNQIGTFVVIGLMANGFRMAALTFFQQAKTKEERRETAATVSLALVGMVAVGAAILVALAPELCTLLQVENETLIIFGSITVLLEAGVLVPLALMQARIEPIPYITSLLAMFVFRVAATIPLVALFELGIWGVLIARCATAVLFSLWLNLRELRKSSLAFNPSMFKNVLRFALPFLPAGIFGFLTGSADRFFLVHFSGQHEVGIYALGSRIAAVVSVLAVIPFYKVWSALMYSVAEQADASQVFGRTFSRIIASFTIVGLATSFFAENIILLFGGDEYVGAARIVPILVLAALLRSASDLMDGAFYVKRRTGWKPWILFGTMIISIAGFMGLVPGYGKLGAAWAVVAGMVFHVTATFFISQLTLKVDYERRAFAFVFLAGGLWLVAAQFTGAASIWVRVISLGLLLVTAWVLASTAERQVLQRQLKGIWNWRRSGARSPLHDQQLPQNELSDHGAIEGLRKQNSVDE